MSAASRLIVCNGASPGNLSQGSHDIYLEYRAEKSQKQNVKIRLPDFVRQVNHLPSRILDLLEIAAYIYSGDRLVLRGNKDAVEYHGWARRLHYVFRVRDYGFWSDHRVSQLLSDALTFLTGDESYEFTFEGGHQTGQTSLFDREEFQLKADPDTHVLLFSGGLDSLSGAIEGLTSDNTGPVYLVSHQGQPGTVRTQNQLYKVLSSRFPDRIKHYKFGCNLKGIKAKEETQRSRSFLYCSIAFALSHGIGIDSFYVYENGITGINFPRRQDLINARASRTTHPKALALISELFEAICGSKFSILNPFLWNTKTDVVANINKRGLKELIPSAVSCGASRQNFSGGTHCGKCSQCIDRRFAMYAASLDDIDDASGLYAFDFIRGGLTDPHGKKTLMDYILQAKRFLESNEDTFYEAQINELVEVVEHITDLSESEAVVEIYRLCQKHGKQMESAIEKIRSLHSKPFQPIPPDSFLEMIAGRHYLKVTTSTQIHISELERIKPGVEGAKLFEAAMLKILEFLFAPHLIDPHSQVRTIDGREIIDVTFSNVATKGFWMDMKLQHKSVVVPMELKNILDIGNAEFHQISDRLNKKRGMLGILVARGKNKLDEQRENRHLNDQNKVILTLSDENIKQMILMKEKGRDPTEYISEMYRSLVERS